MSGALQSIFSSLRSFIVVPDAPTIGTATATSGTTATVAYTAPAKNGGATITTYTATSSPGGITGTVSTSGSGTITVSGLSGSTTYTFTVTATNSKGVSLPSSSSNSITTAFVPPTTIGEASGGGYYAGKINVSGTQYYLIVAPKSSGESSSLTYGILGADVLADSMIDGPANTTYLAGQPAEYYQAAHFCKNLRIGGYSDWYLPANNELKVLYYFLKPSTAANNTSFGANPNAVSPQPINTNYSSGNPSQTSAIGFRSGESNAFAHNQYTDFYWSSTSTPGYNDFYAYVQKFEDGLLGDGGDKNQGKYVRAVRRIPV